MWRTKTTNAGFRCEHTQTWNTTDQVWKTESEAQAWANETNAKEAERLEENKKLAAERKARREKLGPLADQKFRDPSAH